MLLRLKFYLDILKINQYSFAGSGFNEEEFCAGEGTLGTAF